MLVTKGLAYVVLSKTGVEMQGNHMCSCPRAVLLEHQYVLQLLLDIQGSPQLPASYPAMAMLALVPPLFFAVMDPRVTAIKQQALLPAHPEQP